MSQGEAAGRPDLSSDPSVIGGLPRRRLLAAGSGAGALGMAGLLAACGAQPAPAAVTDAAGNAAWWRRQRRRGVVNFANWPDYIDALHGRHPTLERFTLTKTVVSQAFSGDIYPANVSGHPHLQLLMPREGAMFWTDNMCIPAHAENPKDAMAVMDYFCQPQVQAVVEYAIDYVCPVPAAQRVLRGPAGWAFRTLAELTPEIGEPVADTASSPYVFPTARAIERSRYYYQFENSEQLAYWNRLFVPIAAGR